MSLADRTDSDRLDDLLEATEKQTAAVNRLAMIVQESTEVLASLRRIASWSLACGIVFGVLAMLALWKLAGPWTIRAIQ